MKLVIINGCVAFEESAISEDLNGRVIRGQG
jgi:hypothetical protein